MGGSGRDDWDFKVDVDKADSADQNDKEVVKKIAKKAQTPKDLKKSLVKKSDKIDLDYSRVSEKISRAEDARRLKAQEIAANKSVHDQALGPDIVTRAKAIIIDFCFCLVVVGALFIYDKMLFKMPRFLIHIIPQDIRSYGDQYIIGLSFFLVAYFIFVILFTTFTGKSIGKKLCRIVVMSRDEAPVHFYQIIWREVFVKPISVLSIIGILFYFIGGKRRMLHDYLSGTSLFYY